MNSRVINSSHAEGYRLARATNPTASSFTYPTATKVADSFPMGPGQQVAANGVFVQPLAVGADGVTGTIRVYGGSPAEDGSYDWTILFAAAFTACTDTVSLSHSGSAVTHRYADTIGTPTVGKENVDYVVSTGIADTRAGIYIDLKGHTLYFVDVIIGTATSVNARVRRV